MRAGALAGFLTADAVSLAGTRLAQIAVPWLVLTTTGSATRTVTLGVPKPQWAWAKRWSELYGTPTPCSRSRRWILVRRRPSPSLSMSW